MNAHPEEGALFVVGELRKSGPVPWRNPGRGVLTNQSPAQRVDPQPPGAAT